MTTQSPRPRSASAGRTPPNDVDRLLVALAHPMTPTIEALRAIIRGVDPRVREEVKWNAPSFATTEHFATFHLRARDAVQVVLHLGAKPRPGMDVRRRVADPDGLLTWRGSDRATVTFRDVAEVEAKAAAFAVVLRQWVTLIP